MGLGAGLLVLGPAGCASASPLDPGGPGGYPKALSFRQPEWDFRTGDVSYEDWESRYLPLEGIVGKVLNDAHYYADRPNLEYFLRYKNQNPSKMVLLHYNGTGRRATDGATDFFPGHWLYYEGTTLLGPIGPRATVLSVADTSVFNARRSMGIPDDIAITRVDARGRPMWGTAEHVRLERINRRDNTITVRRGLYGSRKGNFARGSYLAAHVTTGPYRFNDAPQNNIPLWSYNFSSECPLDPRGRNCGDALAEYLKGKLGPGGELEPFDGIIFDVLSFIVRFGRPVQNVDANADGRADRGVIGGVNTVGVGVNRFLKTLRERLPDKVLLADGHVPNESQRGFGHLNGMESEGYPDKYDIGLDHLSRGENMFDYWRQNGASPTFNFANFRYKQKDPARWRNTFQEPNLSEDKSYEKMRLALASSLFTDTAFAYGGVEAVPPEVTWRDAPGGETRVRVFDELWKGTEQVPRWLGQPAGEAVHLAADAPDLFEGGGKSWSEAFVRRFEGEQLDFSRTDAGPYMVIRSTGPTKPQWMEFALPGIEVPNDDLFVTLRLRAEPLEDFPASVPRRVDVYAVLAGDAPVRQNQEFTWVGPDPFEASFYFQDVGPGRVSIRFEVEGRGRVYFERMTAHSAADGRYREYEGGIVFANPSTRPYTFELATLFPEADLQRIQGSPNQDPDFNNGDALGNQVTLSPRNGLFVARTGGG